MSIGVSPFFARSLALVRVSLSAAILAFSSEPHDEEQEIDFRRLHNWIDYFHLRPFGLPSERNGDWLIPDEERGLHASGHACGKDLLDIARAINPEILIPVHSEQPEFYVENLEGTSIRVNLPAAGTPLEV